MAKHDPEYFATGPKPAQARTPTPSVHTTPVRPVDLTLAEVATIKSCAARILGSSKLIVQQDDPDFSALVKIAERL